MGEVIGISFSGARHDADSAGPRDYRGRAGWPDLGLPGLAVCRLPGSGGSIWRTAGGCQEERRTPGTRAGRTTATSGSDGLISRALNGTSSLIA